jgi:CHASE2 domain-containing sensor protein
MTDRQPQPPMWLRARTLTAAGIGLLATGMAWLGWSATPAIRTSIDWGLYDRWVQQASLSPADSAVVLITRDAATDARFGPGAWDRALIARMISAVHDGGASVIGVDLNVLEPSPPQRGGPASDAQLAETTSLTGNVIYPLAVEPLPHFDQLLDGSAEHDDEVVHPSWVPLSTPPQIALPPFSAALHHLPLAAHHAQGIGHVGAIADPDRTVRRTPLFLTTTHRAVPAFGLLLAAAYYNVSPSHLAIRAGSVTLPDATSPAGDVRTITIPTDRQGVVLTQDPGDGRAPGFALLSFEDVWTSIEQDDPGRLRAALAGKIAVLFPASTTGSTRTAEGMAPEALKRQLYLLNTILTGRWATAVPERWSFILSVALAGLMAWLTLRGSGWSGPMFALGALALFVGITVGVLWIAHWIIPMAVPLSGGLLAIALSLGWDRLATARRLRWLEQDRVRAEQALLAIREALTIRESAVEALEEDLETARRTMAQSAGQQAELARTIEDLRSQAAEAQAQETEARARLAQAEQTIQAMQTAPPVAHSLSDHEQERLRQECAELGILTQDPAVLGLFRTLKKAAHSSLASAEPPRAETVSRREHGGRVPGTVRERAVRPRAGQFHRRRGRSQRPL